MVDQAASLPDTRSPVERAVVRFAGDSGDGMQLTGSRFADEVAWAGNDLATLPNFPAEIRAPAGTTYGVSSFQIQFGSVRVHTPGDTLDVLVAMNPAALKVHLRDLRKGGVLIVNENAFESRNITKAGFEGNPLEDPALDETYRVYRIEVTRLTLDAVEGVGLDHKAAQRCKNFFCLGVVSWLFNRPIEPTVKWATKKFGRYPEVLEGNLRALKTGHAYAETTEIFSAIYDVAPAALPPGTYRQISGNQALALGMVVAARRADRPLVYGAYPITPASDVLHHLAPLRNYRVRPFQAEDEIAAVCAAIGAAYGGAIGVTCTSGPGLALKGEAIGLAVMAELPIVVLNIQRGGPSTGLPTRTEQADLNQALFGRNGECPCIVIAPASPGECFYLAYEAVRLALKYMTPVVLLSDGYLANGSEPWKLPDLSVLPPVDARFAQAEDFSEEFQPYQRNPETLARPWAIPGTPGLEHRVGGLEKENITGNVSYDPDNHDLMTRLREEKVERVVAEIPPTEILGPEQGKLLVVGWGSTRGAIEAAVGRLQQEGQAVSAIHLRHLNPLPPDLGDILSRFERVLVPEMNRGQLLQVLRARFLMDARGLNQVRGLPIASSAVEEAIHALLAAEEVSS